MLFLHPISGAQVRGIVFVEVPFEHKFLTAILTLVLGFRDLLNIRRLTMCAAIGHLNLLTLSHWAPASCPKELHGYCKTECWVCVNFNIVRLDLSDQIEINIRFYLLWQ